MIGAIIGDIAGSRFEFDNHRSKEFKLFADSCKATDDSIMTLAVAKAIIETDKIRQHAACNNLYDSKYYALLEQMVIKFMRGIGRRYPNCGYGGSFYHWVFSNTSEPYHSFGNGAAMRVSSAGFAARTEGEARELSEAVTKVTHNHPEGIKGAEAVAVAVFMAQRGFTKEEIREKISGSYYPLDFMIDRIRDTYEFNETCQNTVPQAIEAFLESVSFEDAIRLAVSVGGDSDTLAAITGSIAQAYYDVPEELEQNALSYLDDDLRSVYDEWKTFAGENGKSETFRVLTKYIGKIESAVFSGDWVIDRKNDGSPEHPIQFPLPRFSGMICSFQKEFYQFSESHPEYQSTNYEEILKRNGLKWDGDIMRGADADTLNAGCVLALLMGAVRAEHFCDGALLEFLKDGSILKWLKRLKSIDDGGKAELPEEICLSTGGFGIGYQTYRIIFDKDGATRKKTSFHGDSTETHVSPGEAELLKARFAALHTEYWNCEYDDENILDGEQWELAVKYEGRRGIAWEGSNAYPPNWTQVLDLFGVPYEKDDEVKIRKLMLRFSQNRHLEPKHLAHGIDWDYTDSITVDHETGCLVLKQTLGSGCVITHQYNVQGGMDDILCAVDDCLRSEGWVDTEKHKDDTGIRFYRLNAEYYNNSEVTHTGVYNRAGLPEGSWSKLIDIIWNFIEFYGFGELLDKRAFLSAGKPGEIKYCSVAFEEYGRTFYYQTDDESIGIGDAVLVPFGAANAQRRGTVEEIGYYSAENVPFPLEKTKKILLKVDTEEDSGEAE